MSLAARAAVVTLAAWVSLLGLVVSLPSTPASAHTSPARRVLPSVIAQGGGDVHCCEHISSAKLILCLDSDLGVTSASGRVSQWDDQSTEGNDFTAAGNDRPFLIAGDDGHDALQGQADQRMVRTSGTFSGFAEGDNGEAYIVAEFLASDAEFSALFELTNTDVGDGWAMYKTDGDALNTRMHFTGQAFPDESNWSGFDSPTGGIDLYNSRAVGGSTGIELWVNGVEQADNGFFAGDGAELALINARLFNSAGSEPLDGDIYLVVMTNEALTSGERTDFEDCIASAYPSIGMFLLPPWGLWPRRRRRAANDNDERDERKAA